MNTAFTFHDIASISPLLILLAGALIILLVESLGEPLIKKFFSLLTSVILITALCAALYAPVSHHPFLVPWLRFDFIARFFTLFFLVIGLGATWLAYPFFQRFEATEGEYFFLLLSSLFGLILIGSSADFLTLFLGIETLSIALYVSCGYMKKWGSSSEAALKYFLMGALAAAFFLYGVALIYGATGTTSLRFLLEAYDQLGSPAEKTLFLSGIALVTLGLAFEAALVPFHVWAPDVYEGASTPVTAFMAVGTKVGAFAAFIVIFFLSIPRFDLLWNQGMAWLAYPTLIYANFVALRQVQLRRFFAYSGIAQAGFMLIPVIVNTPESLSALIFYLVVYALATFGCFSVMTFLDWRKEGVMIEDLRGLFYRSPLSALMLTLCLLTLAGIPPTAGFLAKFYIFKVAFQAGYYGLVVVGLLTTILAIYYYLRIVSVMFSGVSEVSGGEEIPAERTPILRSGPATLVGLISMGAILILSIYPNPFLVFF